MRSDVIAYINTDDLIHNFRALRKCCRPGVKICAALKADAYGHSMSIVSPALYEAGADYAAVATLKEAVELRGLDWDRPILVLGNVLAVSDPAERDERLEVIVEHRLTVTISDEGTLDFLSRQEPEARVDAHLKIDTGMGRMGVTPDLAPVLLRRIISTPQIRLAGVYSHFGTADFEDVQIASQQLDQFHQFLDAVRGVIPAGVLRHLSNSAATITLPDAHFDMVRPGLALYGYYPSEHMRDRVDLRPVLRVVSHFTAVKELPVGHGVGYAKTFVTRRPTKLGILPIGYADGFIRLLSNNAVVGTSGGDAPVIGRVSMDQLAVDLTDLPGIGVGAEAELIGNDATRPNSVEAIAARLGTIPYEVTCLLGSRIERVGAGKSCAIYGTVRSAS